MMPGQCPAKEPPLLARIDIHVEVDPNRSRLEFFLACFFYALLAPFVVPCLIFTIVVNRVIPFLVIHSGHRMSWHFLSFLATLGFLVVVALSVLAHARWAESVGACLFVGLLLVGSFLGVPLALSRLAQFLSARRG